MSQQQRQRQQQQQQQQQEKGPQNVFLVGERGVGIGGGKDERGRTKREEELARDVFSGAGALREAFESTLTGPEEE